MSNDPPDDFSRDILRKNLFVLGLPLLLIIGFSAIWWQRYQQARRLEVWGANVGTRPDGSGFTFSATRSSFDDEALPFVERFERLEQLRLPGTAVSDAGLVKLRPLQSLHALDLSRTSITDATLVAIARWPALRQISLEDCPGLTPQGLEVLRQLPQLESLSVGRCPMSLDQYQRLHQTLPEVGLSIAPESLLQASPAFQTQWLRSEFPPQAKVTVAGHVTARDFAAVKCPELVVEINSDKAIWEAASWAQLQRFTQLRKLTLGTTTIVGDDALTGVASCPRLQTLRTLTGDFTDAGLSSLWGLKELQTLMLRSEAVSGPGLAGIESLTSLQTLSVTAPNADPQYFAVLAELRELRDLSLVSCQLTDSDLDFVLRLPHLQSLDLYGNPLSGAAIPILMRAPQLTSADVRGGQITAPVLQAFTDYLATRRNALAVRATPATEP